MSVGRGWLVMLLLLATVVGPAGRAQAAPGLVGGWGWPLPAPDHVVQVFDPPRAISWEPGQYAGDGSLGFGGWVWRYDLTPAQPSGTEVTLSYDWSAVPDFLREHIGFPPFPPDHLGNSLAHLAELAAACPLA